MNTLMNYVGERKRFVAKYIRFGKRRGIYGDYLDTILIKKVFDVESGIELKDHAWIDYAPEIKKKDFKKGDWLCFDATVGTYLKGTKYKTCKCLKTAHMTLEAGLYGFQNVKVIHI